MVESTAGDTIQSGQYRKQMPTEQLDTEARTLAKLTGALIVLSNQEPFPLKGIQGKSLVRNFLDKQRSKAIQSDSFLHEGYT